MAIYLSCFLSYLVEGYILYLLYYYLVIWLLMISSNTCYMIVDVFLFSIDFVMWVVVVYKSLV